MRTAPPPRPGKSLLLASVKGNLGISAISQQMRRLFGPRGGAAWGDVSAATDVYVESIGDDYAARAAYRKAKKRQRGSHGVGGPEKKSEKAAGRMGGQTPNSLNQKKTSPAKPCNLCYCGYYLLPKGPSWGLSKRDSALVTPPSRSSNRPPYS